MTGHTKKIYHKVCSGEPSCIETGAIDAQYMYVTTCKVSMGIGSEISLPSSKPPLLRAPALQDWVGLVVVLVNHLRV